jgi:mannose-6-phosphate isomerase-like protein (cupin superfamily)
MKNNLRKGAHSLSMQTIRFVGAAVFLSALTPLVCQSPARQPLTFALDCPGGDCPLLRGYPQTAGMRSGFVRLKSGQSVGWHTTGHNEEFLIVLRGAGAALIEGQPGRNVAAPYTVYIPPGTRHNVTNTGAEPLEYVYVVAPAAGR